MCAVLGHKGTTRIHRNQSESTSGITRLRSKAKGQRSQVSSGLEKRKDCAEVTEGSSELDMTHQPLGLYGS